MHHLYAPSAAPDLNVNHKQIREIDERIFYLDKWMNIVYAAIPVLGIRNT